MYSYGLMLNVEMEGALNYKNSNYTYILSALNFINFMVPLISTLCHTNNWTYKKTLYLFFWFLQFGTAFHLRVNKIILNLQKKIERKMAISQFWSIVTPSALRMDYFRLWRMVSTIMTYLPIFQTKLNTLYIDSVVSHSQPISI